MKSNIEFASITEIALREYFPREGNDFTPWLAEKIDLLGEAIGIDLIDAETEVRIGDYRLDIMASDASSDRKVAIENQFESTDHRHLGQLITYMAGIEAKVVVWIAEEFRYEHISAINHLNEISDEEIAFFCVRPRLIRIGDSDPSLEFIVVAKPDKWLKDSKSTTEYTPPTNKDDFLNSLKWDGKEFFTKLFKFSVDNGLPVRWGKVGFSLNVELDGKLVSFLRGYSPKSNYGQILGTTFGFIEKYVQDGELIVKEYKDGLAGFFVSTGPGMKWNIKNVDYSEEEQFYKVLNKVIDKIRENGLIE